MELNTFFIGTVIGSFSVITPVAIIWFTLIIKQPNLYVPLSWFLIIATIVTVFIILGIYSFEATAGFVTAYLALTWIPLFIGLHLGFEALSVLTVTSIMISSIIIGSTVIGTVKLFY